MRGFVSVNGGTVFDHVVVRGVERLEDTLLSETFPRPAVE